MPKVFLIFSLSFDNKRLLNFTSPDVGGMSPINIENVVVLPAPLCPNNAVICPSYMSMSSLSTAVKSLNFFVKLRISRHFSSFFWDSKLEFGFSTFSSHFTSFSKSSLSGCSPNQKLFVIKKYQGLFIPHSEGQTCSKYADKSIKIQKSMNKKAKPVENL